jgi:hypothetical protein
MELAAGQGFRQAVEDSVELEKQAKTRRLWETSL